MQEEKIVSEKIGSHIKKTRRETQNLVWGWGNLTGDTDKNFMTINKNDKTTEKRWNILAQKGKSNNTRKNTNTT